ncbi:MAG: energy-coupling factor ABC transporter ATP-binding protein [Anaerolineaceae bacterium]|nr:energy-coupling factor ABC transporter ATP-binding protein [Anaerolineaceae bacterium]
MHNLNPLVVENLSFQYARRETPAIQELNFELKKGELILIAGSSGCGKTTLMRCVNGLIPHTYHGEMSGDIKVFGKSVQDLEIADISSQVGTVLQDPERQIVASYVFNEIAFGLENLGLSRDEIRERIVEVTQYLKIENLKDRETFQLSGGEKQKVALAGVLAMRPRILLLDEPLASLDPASAQEALGLFRRLVDDGISIILVEHRVEDVLTIEPDHVLYMVDGKQKYLGDRKGILKEVDYSRIKLPAKIVRERAKGKPAPEFNPVLKERKPKVLVEFTKVDFQYADNLPKVLDNIDLKVHQGDVIAILGHNGAGKTTLVKHALGLLKPTSGKVLLDGKDTQETSIAENAHTIGYVFQSPTQMLFAQSVYDELKFGPENLGRASAEIEQDVQWAIETVHLESELKMPPLALSFGQQKRISIAAILAMRSKILMMDEPTAGQDYWNYISFMDSILEMPGFESILFITHDVDLAVIYANRVVLVDKGRIMADGPTHEVLADEELLKHCRVLPTSLLKMNLEMLPKTGKFKRAETLAHY